MYCFRLLLPEISWPFALRFGTGSDSVEPLTLGAVPQMLVSITNCFMHIPATWGNAVKRKETPAAHFSWRRGLKMSLWLELLLS